MAAKAHHRRHPGHLFRRRGSVSRWPATSGSPARTPASACRPARLGLGYGLEGVTLISRKLGPDAAADILFSARILDATGGGTARRGGAGVGGRGLRGGVCAAYLAMSPAMRRSRSWPPSAPCSNSPARRANGTRRRSPVSSPAASAAPIYREGTGRLQGEETPRFHRLLSRFVLRV